MSLISNDADLSFCAGVFDTLHEAQQALSRNPQIQCSVFYANKIQMDHGLRQVFEYFILTRGERFEFISENQTHDLESSLLNCGLLIVRPKHIKGSDWIFVESYTLDANGILDAINVHMMYWDIFRPKQVSQPEETDPTTLPFYGIISPNLADIENALADNENILYGLFLSKYNETEIEYFLYTRGQRFEFVDERQKTRNIVYSILAKYVPIMVLVKPDSTEEYLLIKTNRINPDEFGELLDEHIQKWRDSKAKS